MKHRVHAALLLLACALAAPAGARAQGADSAAAPAVVQAPRPARAAWTADRRRFGPGDLVTVLVDEQTLASADKAWQAQRENRSRYDLAAGYGLVQGVDVGVGTGTGGESRDRGRTSRQDRFAAEITARVVAVEPTGVLRIEGRKRMRIDEHEQEVTLTGWVRPEDVSAANAVESWRVDGAEIAYTSNGLVDRPRGSFLSRLLQMIWP